VTAEKTVIVSSTMAVNHFVAVMPSRSSSGTTIARGDGTHRRGIGSSRDSRHRKTTVVRRVKNGSAEPYSQCRTAPGTVA
jgi:hypothetical protein